MKAAAGWMWCGLLLAVAGCASSGPPRPTWELLMPPIKEGQIYTYDLEAPLGSWDAVTDAGYASKDLCETDWSAILDNWKKQAVNRSEQHGGTFQVELGRMKNARCVATDDPRLVGAN